MAKWIKIVQVAFNVLDPDQLQQYEHVRKRPNQSGYLKRLVQRDMDGVPVSVSATASETHMSKGLDNDFTLEGFI